MDGFVLAYLKWSLLVVVIIEQTTKVYSYKVLQIPLFPLIVNLFFQYYL